MFKIKNYKSLSIPEVGAAQDPSKPDLVQLSRCGAFSTTDEYPFIHEIVTMTYPVWQILSQKYDLQPHYTWPAELRYDDGHELRFSSVIGGLLVHYTRGFQEPTRRPSDLTFWRGRWYNVFTNYHEDGTLRNFYCNVTMPLSIKDSTIIFVDLDLDVQIWPDGSYRILDKDEFEAHRLQYGYPDWVQRQALNGVNEILALFGERKGPFSLLKP
jgi:protein associated with RNAse G/E